MKLPNKLGLKAYLIVFSILAFGNFTSLLIPDGNSFIYYNTLLRFQSIAVIWYVLAIVDAILGCFTVIPLIFQAWNKKPFLTGLFKIFFALRIITIFLGHNYEWVILKSSFIGSPVLGISTLAIWIAFSFPSFKEHYSYAFHSKT